LPTKIAIDVGLKAIPPALLDEIATKTDGVPLFVEEFTKTVLESLALRETDDAWVLDGPIDEIAIPTSLHDSLMARLVTDPRRSEAKAKIEHTALRRGE
jgi:predicted ATPase